MRLRVSSSSLSVDYLLMTVWLWADSQFLLSLSIHMSVRKILCDTSQEFKRRLLEINISERNEKPYSFVTNDYWGRKSEKGSERKAHASDLIFPIYSVSLSTCWKILNKESIMKTNHSRLDKQSCTFPCNKAKTSMKSSIQNFWYQIGKEAN